MPSDRAKIKRKLYCYHNDPQRIATPFWGI